MQQSSSKEMDAVIRVQILDISIDANDFRKDINPSFLPTIDE